MSKESIKKASKIYVAGHKGMVGSAIWRNLEAKGFTNLIGRTLEELDLLNQQAVSDLLKKRTGIDFGIVRDLIPVERGASGRLIKLKIVGDKKTFTIGKELEIRKALSESHLYSSAFVVEKKAEGDSTSFILHGAGWGHGVGLCQIGAAVMGAKGYIYDDILMHYFKGASLEKKY